MLADIEMMTISSLDFSHYMTAVSHEMSDEPQLITYKSPRTISPRSRGKVELQKSKRLV